VAKSLNETSFLMSCNFVPSFILSVQTFSFIWRTLHGLFFLPSSYLTIYNAGARVIVTDCTSLWGMIRLMLLSSQKQKLGDFHVVLDNCHPNNNNDNYMAWGCITVLTLGTVENDMELPYYITAGKRFMWNEICYKEPEADKTILFRVF